MTKLIPLNHQANVVRGVLSEHLKWSLHDFIRRPSTFLGADRKMMAEHLTRKMEESDDFRFVYKSGRLELALFMERLPWDSNFFGYEVGRLNGIFLISEPFISPDADYSEAIQLLLEQAKRRGIRYLFAPVFPEDLAAIRALNQARFALIETRCYHHRSVKNYAYPDRFDVRVAALEDIESLGEAAQTMVNQYDRFHADSFISLGDSNRLMYKWVQASIRDNFADVTIVPAKPSPTAFVTVNYHQDKWDSWGLNLSQMVFGAVSPQYKGWYLKLISEIVYHLKDIGADHCFLATQITNRAVIHVWEKLGFSFGRGEHVFRIVL